MHLFPHGVSMPVGASSCFVDAVGDVTNLGIGYAMESGHHGSNSAVAVFDNNAGTSWNSETVATTNSFCGWDWLGCQAMVRRWTIRQGYNATNGTYRATTAVLEVSNDLTNWTVVDTRSLNTSFGEGIGPLETFDVASPVLARAARIRPTALTGGGGSLPIPTWVVFEAEFIENVT